MAQSFILTRWWLIFAELNTAIKSCWFISSCNNTACDKLRCRNLGPLIISYYCILVFVFFLPSSVYTRADKIEMERRGGKCQKRKREGVQIKCESITYRKQFSLAQVERKLERKLAHHALEPRQRRACTRTRGCTTAHTFVPASVRPTGNWTARKSSWVLGGDCCVMGVSLFILSVSFNSDEKLVSTRWDYRRLWLARTLPERQLNLLISNSVELRLGADWIQRCLFFFFLPMQIRSLSGAVTMQRSRWDVRALNCCNWEQNNTSESMNYFLHSYQS